MLIRSRTLNGTKRLLIISYFLMIINIFYNPSLKLITKRLDLMISSRVKDTGLLLTSSDPLVLVSSQKIMPSEFVSKLVPFCYQGKTFSAEATSELVRKPLYVVGGGDLGTHAASLDAALEEIFDVATAWKAIVLIDEASSIAFLTKFCLPTIFIFRLMFSSRRDRCTI